MDKRQILKEAQKEALELREQLKNGEITLEEYKALSLKKRREVSALVRLTIRQ